ncbi:tRNA pseudouridine(55) synthase TruB [Flagellatimonas centrodinii]|uniref:tRNA pseudouridine(55) synthase TruB n=1 Tax=Flagellatimonas centrodinii TaxID=2806210 RepID=UPI001FEE5AE9|nr:tRNA pseudouridine(55) synthase TruB [Flagellatimonas centrodinii]ULQ45897.1 tRNA pseudouridine(55) synthase TruB [Flagellatimonas centrodinii]
MSAPRRPRRVISGILPLDKPKGLSSNTALIEVRRRFQADKAGHVGSLDPMATGMLPVCLGQATKLCGYLLESDKRYLATVRLGVATDTGDAEGEPIAHSDLSGFNVAALEAVLRQFVGPQQQVPPMYSALKQGGVRLYQLAREGQVVERPARSIMVHALQLQSTRTDGFVVDVRCSKGTYIRVLAEDIARAMGEVAHLVGLRRLQAGPFVGDMVTLEQLDATYDGGGLAALDRLLQPLASALPDWPKIAVDSAAAVLLRRGLQVPVDAQMADTLVAVVDAEARALCLADLTDGKLQPRRWLADDAT